MRKDWVEYELEYVPEIHQNPIENFEVWTFLSLNTDLFPLLFSPKI